MRYGHVKLHLLFVILEFKLFIFSSFLLAFFVYDLKSSDDILESTHLVK
jgi:hypothetical protein